jgi:hypothetical protein
LAVGKKSHKKKLKITAATNSKIAAVLLDTV